MVGREREIEKLKELYESKESEFVAIYGRRRVGKTFLVDYVFHDKITFEHVGTLTSNLKSDAKNSLQKQLEGFTHSLIKSNIQFDALPTNWFDAFLILMKYLDTVKIDSKRIVFIDEIQWMDSKYSDFMQAFTYFWNIYASKNNVLLIICGSSNSWMLNNVLYETGGLYQRVTYEMKLEPFTLHECELFFKENNLAYSRYDIAQAYMVFGGIPFYLKKIERTLSLPQNINMIFFKNGDQSLEREFDRLFVSTFTHAELTKKIITTLSTNSIGFPRKELAKLSGTTDNQQFSKILNGLIDGNFILKYYPFGENSRDIYYKLIDPFCIFYNKFIDKPQIINGNFWLENYNSQIITSWKGIAFENLCFNHVNQIKEALGILGISSNQSSWFVKGDDNKKGGQIDMIIDRNDNIINLCEMKFYNAPFTQDKNEHQKLINRISLISQKIPRRKTIHPVLITTEGLTRNEYYYDFDKIVTLDDLFRK